MDEIERATPNFRGGSRDEMLTEKDVLENIADAFEMVSYNQISLQTSSKPIDQQYSDNYAFWKDALRERQFQGMRVQLNGFHLTEWMPLAPGRYFDAEAKESRVRALHSYDQTKGEYNLIGKTAMYLGGIGSVRLSEKTIESQPIYFLGASSSGISHQGIPIALYESEYKRVIQIIKDHGGCLANIVGSLKILPLTLSFVYFRRVPKHCLVLDNIEIISPSPTSQLSTTIAITFQLDREFSKGWTFNTFIPGSREITLDKAVDKLNNYIRRYSSIDNPKILFDFDEIYSHFTDNVEFPISQIFKDRADPKQVHDYESYYHIQIRTNQLEMGDIIDARGSHGFENRPINTSKVVDTRGGDYVEGDIDKRQNTQSIKDTHSSPWSSGSFYLVIFLMIIIALAVIGHILPWYTFPIVIIGGLLALSVVGAFQLRQDNRLSEESFLKLMALSFKYIPWLRGSNTGNVQDALPETSNSSHKSSK